MEGQKDDEVADTARFGTSYKDRQGSGKERKESSRRRSIAFIPATRGTGLQIARGLNCGSITLTLSALTDIDRSRLLLQQLERILASAVSWPLALPPQLHSLTFYHPRPSFSINDVKLIFQFYSV